MPQLESVTNAEKIKFKPKFQERYEQLTDWEQFRKFSLAFLRRCIRINTVLTTVKETKTSIESKGWILTKVPWSKEAFWIDHPERRDVGNLLEHKIGKIYVQEAASMIPPLVLDPKPGDVVLDMCAAPGSKTTQMGAMMNNEGLIVANDYKGQRLQSLGINLQRSGLTNVIITLMDGNRFHGFQFDKILADVPCSGTGTIRKSLKTINIWNPHMITKLARAQMKLAANAFRNLKPGGEMVYSTCSVEPEENEGVIHYLLNEFDNIEILSVKLPGLKTSIPIMEFLGVKYHKDIAKTIRIWPQDNDTEGFYVAKLKKKLPNEA